MLALLVVACLGSPLPAAAHAHVNVPGVLAIAQRRFGRPDLVPYNWSTSQDEHELLLLTFCLKHPSLGTFTLNAVPPHPGVALAPGSWQHRPGGASHTVWYDSSRWSARLERDFTGVTNGDPSDWPLPIVFYQDGFAAIPIHSVAPHIGNYQRYMYEVPSWSNLLETYVSSQMYGCFCTLYVFRDTSDGTVLGLRTALMSNEVLYEMNPTACTEPDPPIPTNANTMYRVVQQIWTGNA